MVDSQDVVEYVIDVNPRRQGKFLPGTGHEIVAPGFLTTYRPDVVLLSNGLYEVEIKAQLRSLDLTPEVLVI